MDTSSSPTPSAGLPCSQPAQDAISGSALTAIVTSTFAITCGPRSESADQQTDMNSSGNMTLASALIESVVTASVSGTATAISRQPRGPGEPYRR